MKVYITKYALTAGIQVKNARLSATDDTMVHTEGPHGRGAYYHRSEWHTTWQDALIRAKYVRLKKLGSLRKSLDKLEAMTFPATEPEEKT